MKKLLIALLLLTGCDSRSYVLVKDSYNTFAPVNAPVYAPVSAPAPVSPPVYAPMNQAQRDEYYRREIKRLEDGSKKEPTKKPVKIIKIRR